MTSREFQEARKSLGLSSAGLARMMGVHPVTVRRWESSLEPPVYAVLVLHLLRVVPRSRWP